MLINSQLVKDHFGQYYKIQTSGDTPAPAVLTHERFHSTTQACRFIQNITVPFSFWKKILQSNNAFITINYKTLGEAGAGLEDVVRTRMFVTDIEQWSDVARAHQEAFGQVMPATTMVEVSKLIDPRMLVEIEADAFLEDD